jgi:hypothetical protein
MFVVWTFFAVFLKVGGAMRLVPVLFAVTILCAGALGFLISRFYSEPLNRKLRRGFDDGPKKLGSAREPEPARLSFASCLKPETSLMAPNSGLSIQPRGARQSQPENPYDQTRVLLQALAQ